MHGCWRDSGPRATIRLRAVPIFSAAIFAASIAGTGRSERGPGGDRPSEGDPMKAVTLRDVCMGLLATTAPALTQAQATPARDIAARALVRDAVAAQGGEAALRAVKAIEWRGSGYRAGLEQSERPEGPYIVEFDTVVETHDVAGQRLASTTSALSAPFPRYTTGVVADRTAAMKQSGTAASAGNPDLLAAARETLALSPERLLLTALDAADLSQEADEVLQDIPHNVVRFSLDGAPVRIFLNAFTHLPTAVDYSGPLARSGYWRFLGDVTMRTRYGLWWLAKGGVRLPLQADVARNGMADTMVAYTGITINAPLDEQRFHIPADTRAAFASGATPASLEILPFAGGKPPVEPAPGVLLFSGAWNVTLVRQDDGIVVIEAPISSGYSANALAEAERRFPGVPVKALVTTSDSWPHLAGVREYVARGIPIYCLDLNAPILQRLIAAPRRSKPDSLERHPRTPQLRRVTDKTTIGTGDNRIELYPLRGETSERQMMAYFPAHHLLYGSDPFQQIGPHDYAYPQTVSELVDAVARYKLAPTTFFMMHIGPTPWSELPAAVARSHDRDSPAES